MDFSALNKQIYADITTNPVSATEERELFRRYQETGDLQARQRIIESNLRFVIKVALPYRDKGLPLVDLIQEGNLGLIDALEKFDPQKKCRLITYASWWIRLYIQRALEMKNKQVSFPVNKSEVVRRINFYQQDFRSLHGRKPYIDEIAKHVGLEEKKVQELLNYFPSFCTLHFSDKDHPGLESVLIDETLEDPRETTWMDEATSRLASALRVLTDRERDVLHHRFNLNKTGRKTSLRKVGLKMNLSAEGVRRIEQQALGKLRRPAVQSTMETLFA